MSTLKLEDLPAEIMIKIFLNLGIVDLINCGQLSKKIRTICNDSSIWRKINLCSHRVVPTGFLELIKNNGCRYLSLCYAHLKASIGLNQVKILLFIVKVDDVKTVHTYSNFQIWMTDFVIFLNFYKRFRCTLGRIQIWAPI